MTKICIEGNIGCGKSTLLTRLCNDMRLPVFLEPVDEWKQWLDLFYRDPARWGLSFNIKVLLSFNQWKNNSFFALYERSPLSNRHVFCQLQYDQGRLTDIELEMFDQLYKELHWMPDVIIYIRTSPEVSMQRMQKRGRDCENKVPMEYIAAVHDMYEKLARRYPDKVKIIDGDQDADAVYERAKYIIKCHKERSINA